jgi:hypothetical protein
MMFLLLVVLVVKVVVEQVAFLVKSELMVPQELAAVEVVVVEILEQHNN